MNRLNIALVGLGDIAQKAYLPVVTQHSKINPILLTRNTQVLAQLQQQYRIGQVFDDYQELLAYRPGRIMIHSSTESHFLLAKRALEAGIATFVDKPLAYNLTQVAQLAQLAQQQQTPLFIGFNRRYAPLLVGLPALPLRHVRWQKNRCNLPAPVREFIFDDFIHVVDGLRHLADISAIEQLDNVTVFSQKGDQDQLHAVHFSFEVNGRLFQGAMDRLSGLTEEWLEVTTTNEKWRIESLTQGMYSKQNQAQSLGFDDWQPTLYKRGFYGMIDTWVEIVANRSLNLEQLQKDVLSHQICEQIVQQIA